MSNSLVTIGLPLALLFFLLACRTPVAFALGLAGAVGIALEVGSEAATSTIGSIPFSTTASYTLTLVPMFILLGLLISHAGLLDGIFDVAQRITRRLPGGLGVATIAACSFLGGITGASVADAATIGRFAIPELAKRGYDRAYAASIVAAAGTITILIPPSVVLVIFGIVTGESIGALLLAGVIPGLLTAVAYAVIVIYKGRSGRTGTGARPSVRTDPLAPADDPSPAADPYLASGAGGGAAVALAAPAPAATTTVTPLQAPLVDRVCGTLAGVTLFAIVVGGIYAGVFTATEAAGVGAFAALLISCSYVLLRRGRELPGIGRMLGGALQETAGLTATIFILIVGATIFTQFLVLAGVPDGVGNWITDLDLPPHVIVFLFLLVLLPLGMFLDGLSILLIVAPIFYPTVIELGFDGVWFGVLFVVTVEIGLLTPPVGLNVFVVSGLFPDIRAEEVFRKVLPFIGAQLVMLAFLFLVPEVVTFLPDLAADNAQPER